MNYPKTFLGEKLQNHSFWCPGPLYPQFILVDLIFLEGDCQQVLFEWMIWNMREIGAINNTPNLWWINQGQSVFPLDMVHNQLSGNHNIKSKLAQKHYGGNIWHMKLTKLKFQFFVHLTSFVVALSLKLYCFISPFVRWPWRDITT